MRHFGHLSSSDTASLFERPPEPFDRDSGPELLSVALGATLYMPADRPALPADITKQADAGVTSVVVCLEDAIADEQVGSRPRTTWWTALRSLHDEARPSCRCCSSGSATPAQIPALVHRLGPAAAVLRRRSCCPSSPRPPAPTYLHALDEADRQRRSDPLR